MGREMLNPQSVMNLFSSFRPSDRKVLAGLAEENPKVFVNAMELYLHRWSEGDWVEDYSIERIAKWIARSCSPSLVRHLEHHANERLGANSDGLLSTVYVKTYKAMLEGLTKVPEHA